MAIFLGTFENHYLWDLLGNLFFVSIFKSPSTTWSRRGVYSTSEWTACQKRPSTARHWLDVWIMPRALLRHNSSSFFLRYPWINIKSIWNHTIIKSYRFSTALHWLKVMAPRRELGVGEGSPRCYKLAKIVRESWHKTNWACLKHERLR